MSLAATPHVRGLILTQRRRQARALQVAGLSGMVAASAAALLLGISGWFLTGAALAGVAGLASAQAFNFLLPSAAVRLMAILRTGFRYLERIKGHEAALRALAGIRPAIFLGLAAAPLERSLALSGGEASARLMQDVNALETLFIRLSLSWTLAAALATGLGLTSLAGRAPAAALAAFAGAAMFTAWTGSRLAAAAGRDLQVRTGELKDHVAALLAAAPELRCYGLEDWASQEIDRRGRAVGATQVRVAKTQARIAAVQAAIVGVGAAVVLALAAKATTPLAALAGLAAVMTLESVGVAGRALLDNGAAMEAARRLEPLLGHGPRQTSPISPGATLQIAGDLFAPGERIAVTGASGSGKTTLLERLVGLRKPPSGGIKIDGVDLADDRRGIARSAFAYAPQDAAMLAGTVRENLSLAAEGLDDAALWAALGDACLEDRIRRMPQGLDTWIGENGARLSGGERRRLSLARAFLRPAPWLLLDEPTEGLDAATEARVLDRLQHRLDRTGQGLLIASHRAAPRSLCDRMVSTDRLWPAQEIRLGAILEAA